MHWALLKRDWPVVDFERCAGPHKLRPKMRHFGNWRRGDFPSSKFFNHFWKHMYCGKKWFKFVFMKEKNIINFFSGFIDRQMFKFVLIKKYGFSVLCTTATFKSATATFSINLRHLKRSALCWSAVLVVSVGYRDVAGIIVIDLHALVSKKNAQYWWCDWLDCVQLCIAYRICQTAKLTALSERGKKFKNTSVW